MRAMRTRMSRWTVLAALVGLVGGIPASGQIAVATDEIPLQMVVLVNRLELSAEQMRSLHSALSGVLEDVRALETRRATFVEEMIAFTGAADELDARLAAFCAETAGETSALWEKTAAAVDTIKGTLTYKQGEILWPLLAGLLREEMPPSTASDRAIRLGDRDGATSRMGQMQRRMLFGSPDDATAVRKQIADRLRDRLGVSGGEADDEGAAPGAVRAMMGHRAAVTMGARGDGLVVRMARAGIGAREMRFERLEQLVRILELKLGSI